MTQYLITPTIMFMNSTHDGTNFHCPCQQFHPMISWKVCTNYGYVSLRNWKLYWNCTTWRFISRHRFPTIKSWKPWWKRSIDRKLRLRNLTPDRTNWTQSRAKGKKRKCADSWKSSYCVGGERLHRWCGEGRDLWKIERDIRTWARSHRLVDYGKIGILGKVSFPHQRRGVDIHPSHGAKQLWHALDCPKEEVMLSKRVSLAMTVLHTRAVERSILCNGAEMGTDGDGERSRVWFKKKKLRTGQRWNQLLLRTWAHRRIGPRMGRGFCGLVEWSKGWVKSPKMGKARLYLHSWNVPCVLAGPPTTVNGARS